MILSVGSYIGLGACRSSLRKKRRKQRAEGEEEQLWQSTLFLQLNDLYLTAWLSIDRLRMHYTWYDFGRMIMPAAAKELDSDS